MIEKNFDDKNEKNNWTSKIKKSNKGITITSLTIYVIVATVIVGILVFLNANFFSNINELTDKANIVSESLDFKSAFIRDLKSENNIKVTDYNNNMIRLSNNVKYEIRAFDVKENQKKFAIYRNDVQVAKNIVSHTIVDGQKVKEGPYFEYDVDTNSIKIGIKFSDGTNTYMESGTYLVGKSANPSWSSIVNIPNPPFIPDIPSGDVGGSDETSGDVGGGGGTSGDVGGNEPDEPDNPDVPEEPVIKPESEPVYAVLYSDGTLQIGKTEFTPDSGKEVLKNYGETTLGDINTDSEYLENREALENIYIQSSTGEKIQVSDMSNLFAGCTNLKTISGLENLDTSNVTDAQNVFKDCENLQAVDLTKLDTSTFTNIAGFFDGCSSLTEVKLNNVDFKQVQDMSEMFSGCTSLVRLDMNALNGKTSNLTDMSNMFANCTSLRTLNIGTLETSVVTSISRMFYNCQNLESVTISSITSKEITDLSYLFYNCKKLNSINFGNFDTTKVTDMSYMFANCETLNNAVFPNSDTSSVENMEGLFLNCKNIGQINFYGVETDSVTNMSRMFEGCEKLNSFNQFENLKTNKVTNMSAMFKGCTSLNNLNLGQYSSFDTSLVTDFSSMFEGCTNLTNLNISNFNTSSAKYFNRMFMDDTALGEISVGNNWKSDYTGIDVTDMFTNCKVSVVKHI
ncbi:MAG: BspA family leucine-rich repeat surface protein [Clostridia bacterium]|nr:BspA family leucine-rich repeat surface protein [Clostridia bacterium]